LEPDVRDLMKRITVRVDDELEAAFPAVITMRVTARTKDQRERTVEIVNPRGHEDNPVTDVEVAAKFARLARPVYGEERTAEILAGWRGVATAERVSDLVDLLVLRTSTEVGAGCTAVMR
jgi:2-methylcitrate dehydratase